MDRRKYGLGRGALALALCLCVILTLAACGSAQTVETQTAPEPSPAPAAPSPSAPPPPAETPAADAPPEETAPPPPKYSGLAPDGTFGEETLFIGDSLTAALVVYLRMTDRLGAAKYMAICTYPLQSFFGAPFLNKYSAEALGMECSDEFYGYSYAEAVRAAGESVGAIYFMLGTNQSSEVTAEMYTQALSWLRDCCPDATIYAQTIPYSVGHISDYDSVNAVVRESVDALRAAGDDQIFVLDTFSALGTDYMSSDGLHLTPDGLEVWYTHLAGAQPARKGTEIK